MSRAFVKDADYLDQLPERLVSEHPNDVTEPGLAQIEQAHRALAPQPPPRKHQPIGWRLPPRAETFATRPPGVQQHASYRSRPTTRKCGSERQ
jgi:hypothetical protein